MQEHVYDVVVLGTGAAGLTAALRAAAGGAQVGLFEKADTVGGTSAWSGGTVWLPNNRHEAELGFTDSREEVLTYLMSLSHGLMEQPLVEAYVDTAPEVAAWLEDNSPVEFETLRGMSDYHPEHPGGKQEGRSLECTLFPFADLGDWAHRVTVGWQLTGEITMSESSLGRKAPDGVPREELDRRKLRDERGAGQALVGRLLRGCLDRGVHPQARCRGVRLLVGAGRVTGAGIEGPVVDVPRFTYVNHPAWLVFDHHFLSRYGLAGHRPPAPTPDWIIEAPTIAELAERIGAPARALQATVERWNSNVAAGSDPDFRRGDSHHDRAWGDPAFGGTRQGTLGPIDSAPYYAVRVWCGTLGTKGGPRTDTQGRVLDVDGNVIEGLYAAGNAMESVMGMTYGGHGGTLGPGLVFGYLSGRHAAALGARR